MFVQRIAEFLERRESFILESTLSGLSLKRWIEKANDSGYSIKIIFAYLDSPELCVQRIKERVAKGGHNVPDQDVLRRYDRSNRNFWNTYKDLADEWRLFNNGGAGIIQVASSDHDDIMILDEERFEQWLSKVTT